MKTSKQTLHFIFLRRADVRLGWALVFATLYCGAAVRAEAADTKQPVAGKPAGAMVQPVAPAAVSAAAVSVQKSAASQPSAEALSPVVRAVIKMADASVTTTVIKTFVECSPSTDRLTDTDIIALKQHHVADEIVTTLLKQGEKARALDAQRKQEALARVLAARNASSGGLDPESYDYFRYYYLQPRAMASAYQRLSPYYGPWGYYPYGRWPVYGIRHYGYGRPPY